MKKLISCLLAVLLVCSLMSMNAFAVDLGKTTTGDSYIIVGDPSNEGNINEGVGEDLANGSSNADITVNFGQPGDNNNTNGGNGVANGGIIVNRYAVDITYGELILDLTSLDFTTDPTNPDYDEDTDTDYYMVWDVNDHKYVLCTKSVVEGVVTYNPVDADDDGDITDNLPQEEADILNTPFTVTGGVTITNHSDLSVNTELTLDTANNGDLTWTITTENGNANTTPEDANKYTETIAKAEAGIGDAPGRATDGATYKFVASPATTMANGWLDVIGNLLNGTSSVTVGTVYVTISK